MKRLRGWFCKRSSWKKMGIGFLMLVPLGAYVANFRNFAISNDPADWGAFGDYVGGIYAVLVVVFAIYLTRHLEKRDIERNKARTAVGTLYEQIAKIDYHHVDKRMVNRLLRLTKEYELYIPPYLFERLTELHDDYLEAKDSPDTFDIEKEEKVKEHLKKLYDA